MPFSVNVYEHPGFPRGKWDNGVFTGYRFLICAESDVPQVLIELDQPPNMWWPSADYPWGAANSFARWADIRPHPGPPLRSPQVAAAPSEVASYEKRSLLVFYGTLGIQYINGRYIEESLIPTQEIHPFYNSTFQWVTSGAIVPRQDAPFRYFWGWQYILRFARLPSIPATYDNYIGCINSNPVNTFSLGKTFQPRTLLFVPPTVQARYSIASGNTFTVTLRMLHNPNGWDRWWNPIAAAGGGIAGAFEQIVIAAWAAAGAGNQVRAYPEIPFMF